MQSCLQQGLSGVGAKLYKLDTVRKKQNEGEVGRGAGRSLERAY
jgi:hypothetical protein